MCYSLGILVIGSLFWDEKDHRSKWRNSRLDTDNKIYVKVPIRYGRISSLRNNTYTMVISNTCSNDKKIGTAIVIPCRRSITTGQDIIDEAKALWNAEQKEDRQIKDKISAKWGTVGILKNPTKDYPPEIFSDWKKFYNPNGFGQVKFLMCEERPISNEGILSINWPRRVSDDSPIDFDFILATVTAPSYISNDNSDKRDPSTKEIAQEWIRAHKAVEYFTKNRKDNITTFQDKEISKELNKDIDMKAFLKKTNVC
ncbi:MAG: hypothetical protein ABIJ12_13965 [bacterium]